MPATDFTLDATGDMLIKNGDLAIGLSDEQHIEDYLMSYYGEWKENPLIGIGMMLKVEGAHSARTLEALKKTIQQQLIADGYQFSNVELYLNGQNEILSIDIKAERNG